LQVDDGGEDDDSRDEVHDIWQPLSPESSTECTAGVTSSENEMEQADDSTLEFSSASNIDGRRRESIPNDGLAGVGSNEKVDAVTEAVPFLRTWTVAWPREMMSAKTGVRGGSVHVDDTIRYKKAGGERLTLLSPTKKFKLKSTSMRLAQALPLC
jgi:hypothetical protein